MQHYLFLEYFLFQTSPSQLNVQPTHVVYVPSPLHTPNRISKMILRLMKNIFFHLKAQFSRCTTNILRCMLDSFSLLLIDNANFKKNAYIRPVQESRGSEDPDVSVVQMCSIQTPTYLIPTCFIYHSLHTRSYFHLADHQVVQFFCEPQTLFKK